MRISYLVHGFPPRENAGTEQHCAQMAKAMAKMGHQVQVIAATRAPGRQHSECLSHEKNVHHIVNNIPARPLGLREVDGAIRLQIERLLNSFRPDVVHIQHIQFLSADLTFSCPSLFTFHDSWAWCPAGGLELQWPQQKICTDPSEEDCAKCSALWHPQISLNAHRLIGFASLLNPIIATETLHRFWQKLPNRFRIPLSAERGASTPPALDVAHRNRQLKKLINQCKYRFSPSQFLAERAMSVGLDPVVHLPHGLDETFPHIGGGGILYLGTISFHKGADLVFKAVQTAFPNQKHPLKIHGFPVHPYMAQAVKAKPPLKRNEVWAALQKADVLVLGSRWRENSPLVILEARAAGCPVIAPRTGGIPELIEEGVDGYLYDIGSIDDCVRALHKWDSGPLLTPTPPPTAENRNKAMLGWYERAIKQ